MVTERLSERLVEKPWGRHELGKYFGRVDRSAPAIGEVWFGHESTADMPLLIKYIFTSERLSVQVHPDDRAAHASGWPRGKDEAWFILSAQEGATVALGPREESSREAMRAAALDGTIVDLLDWKKVSEGQTILNTAGTVHAIGAGISLIEVQQNVDLTYRLYDYGRDRELHLLEAAAVVDPSPVEGNPATG